MKSVRSLCCLLAIVLRASTKAETTPPAPTASQLAVDLQQITLDAANTHRVRDVQLIRGDIKLYLNEGVLSFLTPVDGRVVAALFTTEGAEAGDAEVILMPPQRSERASLSSFIHSPNLDEHFSSALFLFSDQTEKELLSQLDRDPLHKPPELTPDFRERANITVRAIGKSFEQPLVNALLDKHPIQKGFFYAIIGGRTLGPFWISYDPTQAESVSARRPSASAGDLIQLWTNFRPRHSAPFVVPSSRVSNYQIDATVKPDLSLTATAKFTVGTTTADGRVLAVNLSPRLRVTSATIDGKAAEVFQRDSPVNGVFLLISGTPFTSDLSHNIEVQYTGTVIRKSKNGEYFVDDRNAWYPAVDPVLANFDLTFHCPERLRLVSTGELLDESVADGVRTVHRKTAAPAALAGFNLGEYRSRLEQHTPYSIEVDSLDSAATTLGADPTLLAQTASVLDDYTKRWIPLPSRSLTITPIAGYFGQGFPGLIYLSSVAYIKEENRSAALRNPRFDAFFSELLLPHEIAHQWWGNIVRQSDYRSAWLTEAMANESALEFVERKRGLAASDTIFESFRRDLTAEKDGKSVESAGPVDFGERLIDTHGFSTWQIVLYEKGSWILHMLRARLGDANYRKMQVRMLQQFEARPISNDDFRQLASAFTANDQPDRALTNFFDTWVYGTGIPALSLHKSGRALSLEVADVDDDFLVDVPLRCGGRVHWTRAGLGSNVLNIPPGASSCDLPSTHEFLYLSARR